MKNYSFNVNKKTISKLNNTGNLENARRIFYSGKNKNLEYLIYRRYSWMNSFINENQKGVEVGAGSGLSKEFIKAKNFMITDFTNEDWLDKKMVDALDTKLKSNSLDFIIASNMIHHVPRPILFFEEMNRILKPGGNLIIQDVNCSTMLRFLLRITNHEGYDSTVDVYDRQKVCTDPEDLWAGNNSIPNLLFDDINKFNQNVKQFEIVHQKYTEFLIFINSGGVVSKTYYIPLFNPLLKFVSFIDAFLCKIAPSFFALQRQIVLKKL